MRLRSTPEHGEANTILHAISAHALKREDHVGPRKMKILITSIESASGIDYVTFSSPAGNGTARWSSCSGPPSPREYSVELDINIDITPSHVIPRLESDSPRLSLAGGSTRVVGIVEQLDDDGVAYLRLHESCITMVDCAAPYPPPGTVLCLKAAQDELTVTPIGL